MPGEEVQVLEARLQAMERALARRNDMLAIVAHELRTPASAVLGWSRLLATEPSLPQATTDRALRAISRSVQHQLRLLDDLLDHAMLDRGRLELERRTIDLGEVASAAVESVRPTAHDRGVVLIDELERPLPMDGDARRLEQVVSNLLVNAVSFSPPEGQVVISGGRRGDCLELHVADGGPGFEGWLLPVVFEPFQQGPHGLRSVRGVGMGLAIAKSLVELHGGTIRAQNITAGHGAQMTITLPARASLEKRAAIAAS